MRYATWNGWNDKYNGTSLQGYINATYKELVAVFGKPTDGDGYKVDAQWLIEFDNGTLATIYNYKDGINYNGRSGTPKTQITEWHVGGFDKNAPLLVNEILRSK